MRLPMMIRLNMSRKRLSVPNGYAAEGGLSRGKPTRSAAWGAITGAKIASRISRTQTTPAAAPTGLRRARGGLGAEPVRALGRGRGGTAGGAAGVYITETQSRGGAGDRRMG